MDWFHKPNSSAHGLWGSTKAPWAQSSNSKIPLEEENLLNISHLMMNPILVKMDLGTMSTTPTRIAIMRKGIKRIPTTLDDRWKESLSIMFCLTIYKGLLALPILLHQFYPNYHSWILTDLSVKGFFFFFLLHVLTGVVSSSRKLTYHLQKSIGSPF